MRVLPWLPLPEDPVRDIERARRVTGAAMLRATWHLPPGEVLERHAELLSRLGEQPRKRLSPRQYEALRAIALASVTAWTLGCDHWSIRAVANASSLAVHRHNAALLPESWNYSTHLHFFLLALSSCSAEEREDPEFAAALLEALQLCFAWAYLQAGVSKLRNSGRAWAEGRTLRASWAEARSTAGRWLSRRDPRWAAGASLAALVFELGYVAALLTPGRHRDFLGLSCLAFHGATKATLDISFWHFSWYALPLYGVPRTISERLGRLSMRFRG